jgi:RHH-type transcriptional regulator, rel operon repressor / antitoxin RelB
MPSTTFTVRVESEVKKRLEKLARSTGRTRSFLAAEALNEYLDVNEWQVAGVKRAIASLDRGEGLSHEEVKDWVKSWGRKRERPVPPTIGNMNIVWSPEAIEDLISLRAYIAEESPAGAQRVRHTHPS